MNLTIRQILIICIDILLVGYIAMAMTAFNKPDESVLKCENINIVIAEDTSNGFIDKDEVKKRLVENNVYPKGRSYAEIDCRQIEEALKATPFVNSVECFKSQSGDVNIYLTQHLPIVRVKAEDGSDYYVDDKNCIMPKADCTADMIVATGNISEEYATKYIAPFAHAIMANDFARNLVEQINVTADHDIEVIPRVGSHVVHLGSLPKAGADVDQNELMTEFVERKFTRLQKFYKYGLSKNVGWGIYSDIDIQYDNQIICKQKEETNK